MPLKSYSKTKLKKFKKSIQERLDDVDHEMDDIKDTLETNTRGNSGMAQDAVYSLHMADAGTDSYELNPLPKHWKESLTVPLVYAPSVMN